ncbi:MAG: signal peptidase I [Oscillospiraceae bacterium]|nr:signal peptidase I [Oscillospiraceae bacterium]
MTGRLKVLRDGLHNWKKEHDGKSGRQREKFASAASTVLLAAAILLCAMVMIQVRTRGYVSIGGKSVFRVVTGSMEPEIPVGALLLCEETPVEELRVGDVICFRSLQGPTEGWIITHRVVSMFPGESGELLIETRGDANTAADAQFVRRSNLIGKVVWHSKRDSALAGFLSVLTSGIGFLALVAVPALLIAGLILVRSIHSVRVELKELNEALAQEKERKNKRAAAAGGLSPEEMEELRQEVLRELTAEKGELIRQALAALREETQQGETHDRPDESSPGGERPEGT